MKQVFSLLVLGMLCASQVAYSATTVLTPTQVECIQATSGDAAVLALFDTDLVSGHVLFAFIEWDLESGACAKSAELVVHEVQADWTQTENPDPKAVALAADRVSQESMDAMNCAEKSANVSRLEIAQVFSKWKNNPEGNFGISISCYNMSLPEIMATAKNLRLVVGTLD